MYVILPNSSLAQATLVNRSMPDTEVLFTVPVGISYSSDLDRSAEIVRQVAVELTAEDPRAVKSFTPRVVYRQFGASSIDFVCWLRARDWESHFGLQDTFIRRLHVRFGVEGINIPFPIRTLDLPKGLTLPAPPQDVDPPHAATPR
jgi:small-conductance mechanosensitive channel